MPNDVAVLFAADLCLFERLVMHKTFQIGEIHRTRPCNGPSSDGLGRMIVIEVHMLLSSVYPILLFIS
jgi:hypothetical protein